MPEISEKQKLVMVRIPAGEFLMGSAVGQGEPDEFPEHKVKLDEFLIARYQVTAAQFAGFLNQVCYDVLDYFEASKETTITEKDGRFHPRQHCSDYPANGVSWFGAQAFCEWLSKRTGKIFRLPTEAEWEKAARGGLTGMRYPWGSDSPEGRAQYGKISHDPKYTLCAVGSYAPNAFGLYDVAGNVWEWCQDYYAKDYYQISPYENPKGPEEGNMRVLRGGSWGGLDIQVRCGIRVGEFPGVSEARVGFRLARNP